MSRNKDVQFRKKIIGCWGLYAIQAQTVQACEELVK